MRKNYTGFKNLGLMVGEEVEFVMGKYETNIGQRLWRKPDRVTVVAEYPTMICLDMEFRNVAYMPKGHAPNHVKTCVNKGAMLCGEVRLRRLFDGHVMVGSYVGACDTRQNKLD